MGALKPVRRVQTADRDLNLLQDYLNDCLKPLLANPLNAGRLISQVPFAQGDNTISHGLGRNYVGCFVSIPTTSAFSGTFGSGVGLFVESVQPDRSKFVVINAIQPCVADIFVY